MPVLHHATGPFLFNLQLQVRALRCHVVCPDCRPQWKPSTFLPRLCYMSVLFTSQQALHWKQVSAQYLRCRPAPCCAVLCRAVSCCAVLCRALQCCDVLCYVMLCHAMLCCAVLCHAVPCCAVPCCIMLCHAVDARQTHKASMLLTYRKVYSTVDNVLQLMK